MSVAAGFVSYIKPFETLMLNCYLFSSGRIGYSHNGIKVFHLRVKINPGTFVCKVSTKRTPVGI